MIVIESTQSRQSICTNFGQLMDANISYWQTYICTNEERFKKIFYVVNFINY
jgi:hypothetical protein